MNAKHHDIFKEVGYRTGKQKCDTCRWAFYYKFNTKQEVYYCHLIYEKIKKFLVTEPTENDLIRASTDYDSSCSLWEKS